MLQDEPPLGNAVTPAQASPASRYRCSSSCPAPLQLGYFRLEQSFSGLQEKGGNDSRRF